MLMGANLYSKNAEYALFTTESALIKRKKQNVKKKPVVSVISSYKPAFSLGFFYSPRVFRFFRAAKTPAGRAPDQSSFIFP